MIEIFKTKADLAKERMENMAAELAPEWIERLVAHKEKKNLTPISPAEFCEIARDAGKLSMISAKAILGGDDEQRN